MMDGQVIHKARPSIFVIGVLIFGGYQLIGANCLPYSPTDRISRRKTCPQRGENAHHDAKALNGVLICIHSRHPAKEDSKQGGNDQN